MPQDEGELDFEAIVGRRVRRMREEMGLTQRALADDLRSCGLFIQPATLAKLEAGTRPLRLNEVVQLAAYFHRPVEEMYAPLADLDRHAPQRLAEAAARTRNEFSELVMVLIDVRKRGVEGQEVEDAFTDKMTVLRRRLVVQQELLRLAERGQAAQVAAVPLA